MSEDSLRAWAVLSRAVLGPNPHLLALAETLGPVETAERLLAGRLPANIDTTGLEPVSAEAVRQDLEVLTGVGGWLLTRDNPAWGAVVSTEQPCSAGADRSYSPPVALWVRGAVPRLLRERWPIAIIGARCNTEYGEQVAVHIAGGLTERGWPVISTGGFGIDGQVMRTVMDSGGAPLLMQACGVDRPYPAMHRGLVNRAADLGMVISEFPPGTPLARPRQRDTSRLLAALSGAVVVVEAGLRSGAVDVAAWARGLGRPVFAVPGPVTAPASAGCHRLIQFGTTTLVTSVEDILSGLEHSPADASTGSGIEQ
ncbi:DNA-processing protein DprA [Nocardia macrotermitis]|uniref:Putative DNA processing protein DprA n=1 Tax=Nocardia macrotermitis TaxID=2585198 RepID=A0A7K0D7H5_9NOCA|nr:DNA-processing protein DprA [Nocardia macrotermitis]MQY21706.1 putative DNA processing protein DprA [Nocardia macrotermitis]